MIPRDILEELQNYREGIHPYEFGGFLTAVLANDLVGAYGRADYQNSALLKEYALYLYNEMPARTGDPTVDMWGSYEAVKNTIARQRNQSGKEDDKEEVDWI